MYPALPISEVMRQLAASPVEDITKTLAAKADEELAELSMRQGHPRLEAAAFKTLSVRHGDFARLVDGMTTPAPKNGCFNRAPYKTTNDLRDLNGHVVTSIPFRMAPDCQYTLSSLGQADQRCVDCSWRRDPTA